MTKKDYVGKKKLCQVLMKVAFSLLRPSVFLLSIAVHRKLLLTCGSRSHLQSNSSNPMLKQFLDKKGLEIFYAPSEGQLFRPHRRGMGTEDESKAFSATHPRGALDASWGMFHSLSVLASMVPNCGDMSFCSARSSLLLPPFISVRPLRLLPQAVPQNSSQPIPPPSTLCPPDKTVKLLLESGSSKEPKTCGFPDPLSF